MRRRIGWLLVAALVASACSADVGVSPASLPGQGASSTPLATQPAAKATVKPKVTPKPAIKPKATPKPVSYYKPPGWDGYSDVNCKDFDTHAHAQSFFKGTGGSTSNDHYGLDNDSDGIACETLP